MAPKPCLAVKFDKLDQVSYRKNNLKWKLVYKCPGVQLSGLQTSFQSESTYVWGTNVRVHMSGCTTFRYSVQTQLFRRLFSVRYRAILTSLPPRAITLLSYSQRRRSGEGKCPPPNARPRGGGAKSGFAPPPISAKNWIKRVIFRGAIGAAAKVFLKIQLFLKFCPLNSFSHLRLCLLPSPSSQKSQNI